MTTPNTGTFDVDTLARNEFPFSSSRTTPTRYADTVNIGTSNTAGRDQYNYNYTYLTNYYSQNRTTGPSSSSDIAPSVSFNDAPLGLLSAHFSGRQIELAHIMKAFEAVRGDMPIRFGLYAGPGVGKSQLTLALAKDSFDQGRYKYIFWIPATTIEKLYQGFSKLLHLVDHPDRFQPEEIVRLTSARRWLEDLASGKWLLVLDNVVRETVEFLREHLPRKNNHGNILFTTRTKDVAMALAHTSGERHEVLEVCIPNEENAARLLLEHFEDGEIDEDENKLQKLVTSVGCLPLAIAQAASYMKQTGSTLVELLIIYNSEHKIEMMEWENELSVYQEKSVAATFTFQLDDLQRHFPNVSNLLKILAYFDPERIPLDMLITGASTLSKPQPQESDNVTPGPQKINSLSHKGKGKVRADETSVVHAMSAEMSSLLALIQSPIGLPNAVAQLQSRSLTRKQGSGRSSSLWIHDLTRLIVLNNTKKGGGELAWFENAVELACGAFEQVQNPESPQSWAQCEVLIPHIESLTMRQGICGGANSSLLSANHRIAGYLRSRGRYKDAEALYNQVLKGRKKQLGPEHGNTLSTKHCLGLVYNSQGRNNDAEVTYKQVLSSLEKQLGPEHVITLSSKHNLALVYYSQGRYSDAEMLYKRVLSSQEKQLGPEHVITLFTRHNLALLYNSQQRYSDAEVLYQRVLSSQEKQLGLEHIDTLFTRHNLADLYNSQQCYSDAEVLYQQVLSSREKQLGLEHIDTLFTRHNLAHLYNSQQRYSDAEILFKQVLESREKQLGPEHIDTLITKYSLASVFNSQGRYTEAEALVLNALDGYEKGPGLTHHSAQNAQRTLAKVYTNQGRLDDAKKIIQSISPSPP